MKKLIMFDLDGTIVDTILDLMNAVNYSLLCLKKKPRTKEEILKFVGNGIRNLVLRSLDNDETFLEEALALFKEYYHSHCLDNSKPYEGIFAVMDYCKENNIKMAVVSNKENTLTNKICQAYFKEYMDLFIGERPNVLKKPDPTGVLEVMNLYGIKAHEALYIGDSDVDIKTAQNASIDAIIVSYGFRNREFLEELKAKCIVDTPFELLEEIKKIAN